MPWGVTVRFALRMIVRYGTAENSKRNMKEKVRLWFWKCFSTKLKRKYVLFKQTKKWLGGPPMQRGPGGKLGEAG